MTPLDKPLRRELTLGDQAYTLTIDPDVAFAKLASLAQGAELAAKRLFR